MIDLNFGYIIPLKVMSTIRGVLNRFMTAHINNVERINRSGYDVEYKCFNGTSDDWDGHFFTFNQMAEEMIRLGKGWWDVWVTSRTDKHGFQGQEPNRPAFDIDTPFNIFEILYKEMLKDACDIFVINEVLRNVAESHTSKETGGHDYWNYNCTFFDTGYKEKHDELLYEVEYKLSCYYEDGHLDGLALRGEDGKTEQDEARSEVRSLKKWIKKWKPVITWMSAHKRTIEGGK
jgi:hypothetical protein